jgi:FixJ family two-component response regulator
MTQTVFVIDDDESIRELLTWLMKRQEIPVRAFADANAFLAECPPDASGCIVLDLHMPGMGGIELQRHLKENGIALPIIFLSGRADVPNAVQAVKGGAVDFIEKPFDYKRIVAVIEDCLKRDAQACSEREAGRRAAGRLASLTQREREVLDCIIAGKINRVIAEELDISVKTVEAHRAKIMEKAGVDSVAELVQVALSSRD